MQVVGLQLVLRDGCELYGDSERAPSEVTQSFPASEAVARGAPSGEEHIDDLFAGIQAMLKDDSA